MNLTAQRKMMVSDGGGGNGVSLDGLLWPLSALKSFKNGQLKILISDHRAISKYPVYNK